MSNIQDTLNERGRRYGDFKSHAIIAQSLKTVMYESKAWRLIEYDKKEALEMIAHKIARILNGDPNYKDSWHDIAGYATLISSKLED